MATKVIRNATGERCIRPGRTMAIAGVTHYPGDSNGSRSNGSSNADTIATIPHTGTGIECIRGLFTFTAREERKLKDKKSSASECALSSVLLQPHHSACQLDIIP